MERNWNPQGYTLIKNVITGGRRGSCAQRAQQGRQTLFPVGDRGIVHRDGETQNGAEAKGQAQGGRVGRETSAGKGLDGRTDRWTCR